jgi:tetraacyldisaccharide 4'-kinase
LKKTLQLLLAPISFLYGLGVSIYQGFYLSGFFKTLKFSIPVISVGNLTVGGTGKSPHIEYLIRLLKDYIPVAVLSRGYRRKTSGHILLTQLHTALDVGDEPVQIKNKFPDVPFAVNSNRSIGIPKLLSQHPEIKTILLDDAFQHLEVTPGLNILLTEYSNPYFKDYLLPSGRLREWRYGARRADIIIVTKCPTQPNDLEYFKLATKFKT